MIALGLMCCLMILLSSSPGLEEMGPSLWISWMKMILLSIAQNCSGNVFLEKTYLYQKQ